MSEIKSDDGTEQESIDLDGMRFVFSGGDIAGDWANWKEKIERNGGVVSDTVSEDTDYLIVDAAVDLGELEAAANHGIPAVGAQYLPEQFQYWSSSESE